MCPYTGYSTPPPPPPPPVVTKTPWKLVEALNLPAFPSFPPLSSGALLLMIELCKQLLAGTLLSTLHTLSYSFFTQL